LHGDAQSRSERSVWRSVIGESSPCRSEVRRLKILSVLQFLFCRSAASVVGWTWCFSIFQLAVVGGWDALRVLLLRTFSVEVATPAPQAAWRLPPIHPDVAKVLAIVTLVRPFLDL
jgi:hypothetical protein